MSIFLFFLVLFQLSNSLVAFDGCNASLWQHSYYSSKIWSSSYDDCIMIPSDGIGSMAMSSIDDNDDVEVLPTAWYNIGSEEDVYYNISYNISCDVVDQHDKNIFYTIFRVQSIVDTELYEFDKQFVDYDNQYYVFNQYCGENSQLLRVRKYPYATKIAEFKHQHEYNLNSGNPYNVLIIVGNQMLNDPTHHQIYINNELMLEFQDDDYLYGGIGISALIGDSIVHSSSQVSAFRIHHFDVSNIGYNNDEEIQQCQNNNQDIKHFNWNNLIQNQSLANSIIHNYEMNVNQYELTLSIKLELEYFGYSYADRLSAYGYGTTYVLDFESFDAYKSAIYKPGTCSNRLSSSFMDEPYTNWWNYSLHPYLSNNIGQHHEYLAYPQPTNYWNISMKKEEENSECKSSSIIVYDGKFNLNDLRSCSDCSGNINYLKFINNDEWINISGVFYVNLVSPMSKYYDSGYYYVYQLLSSPFIMSIKKTINILSKKGISLFTLTFVAIFKEDNESKYRLILLTESSDYLYLTINQLLVSPNPLLQLINADTDIDDDDNNNSKCLLFRNNICSQLFEIYLYPVDCIHDTFYGEYVIRFNIECNPDLNDIDDINICNNWLDSRTEPIEDNTIDLYLDIEFQDNICDQQVYLIQFIAQMLFYTNNNFNTLKNNDEPYEVGRDRVYISILLNFEGETYDILVTELINVWLCTIDDHLEDDEDFIVSQDGNVGGCFATTIIDNNQPYHIIQNKQIGIGYNHLNTIIYDRENNNFNTNEVRFSFIVPNDISRNNLYIHSQVRIQLFDSNNTNTTRRILINENIQDQIRHFMDHISIIPSNEEENETSIEEEQVDVDNLNQGKWINKKTICLVVIICVLFVIIIFISNKLRRIRQTRNSNIQENNLRMNAYIVQ